MREKNSGEKVSTRYHQYNKQHMNSMETKIGTVAVLTFPTVDEEQLCVRIGFFFDLNL